ncbi:MAG TPA: hypothetical protein VF571_07175, partial [Pyrinomonadaceae bacterium]
MGFVFDSEFFIFLAVWIGVICIALCLLLTIYALILRIFFVFREQRAEKFRQQWEGLIAESLDELPQNLPHISE